MKPVLEGLPSNSPWGGVSVVIFDLWRTLYLSLDKEPIKDLQEILGHNVQAGAHGHWEAELDSNFLRLCLTTDIDDPKKFLDHVAGRFGLKVPPEALPRFQEILNRESLNLARYEDVADTLEGLKARGYRLGIISNLWAFPEPKIFVENGFGDLFEHRIYSYKSGHAKPDPEIFAEAVKAFGVEPGQCLMVGDNPKADVEGAINAGMKAALIDRPGECPRHLIPAGVRVMRSLTELLELPSIK